MFDAYTAINRYCQSLNGKRLALHETCCMTFGFVLGLFVPENHKKWNFLLGMVLFLLTFIPVVIFFLGSNLKEEEEEWEYFEEDEKLFDEI